MSKFGGVEPETSKKPNRIRILQVDDDQSFLEISKRIIKGMNGDLELDTALCVDDALKKMTTAPYDIVVSDYQMPQKNGLQFLMELKEQNIKIPFILFTGRGREEVAIQALNLGADGYYNKQGNPETVYGELVHGIKSIVGRRRAELEILREREKLKAVLVSSPDAVLITDLNGFVVDCNEAALRLGGYSSSEEIIGRSGIDFIAERDRKEAVDNISVMVKQGSIRGVYYSALKKNGGEYLAELSASLLRDSRGNPTGFVSVIRDITERKKAEDMLRESEEANRNLVESAPDGIASVNLEGKITSANRSFLTMIGYGLEEVVGKLFTELKSSRVEDIPRIQEMFMSLMGGESLSPVEFLFVRRDGTSRWAEVHPGLLIKDGKPVGAQVIMRDITERKKAEVELNESEEKYRILFENSKDAIVVVDFKGNILIANKAAEEMTGYAMSEDKGMNIRAVTPMRLWPKSIAMLLKARSGKPIPYFEYEIKRKDGTLIQVETGGQAIFKDGKPVAIQIITRDISDRVRALREIELKSHVIVARAANGRDV